MTCMGREVSGISGISDQSCAQSLVSKGEKCCTVWEQGAIRVVSPGCWSGQSTKHVTWAVQALCTHHVEMCCWLCLLCCSMRGRAAHGIPKLCLPCQGMGRLGHVVPRCLDITCYPYILYLDLCSQEAEWGRAGWLWLQHIGSSHPLSLVYFYFWGQESSLVLCSLCSSS